MRMVDPCIIRPASGRTKPAIARSTVVLPLPEGPKSTVHGLVRLSATSSSSAPMRCCICRVRMLPGWLPGWLTGWLTDNVGLPSVGAPHAWQEIDDHQREHGEDDQDQRGLVGGGVVAVLH